METLERYVKTGALRRCENEHVVKYRRVKSVIFTFCNQFRCKDIYIYSYILWILLELLRKLLYQTRF